MVLNAVFVFVLLLFLCPSKGDDSEHDILEKVAKVEDKIKKLEKERESFQKTVISILDQRKDEMQQIINAQNENLKSLRRENEQMRDLTSKISTPVSDKSDPNVAFNAYATSSRRYSNGEMVKFPHVLLNEGGAYNKYTGCFIAPFAGLYFFSAHICHYRNYHMVISIVKGNTDIAITTEVAPGYTSCSSVSATAMLEFGESVYIRSSYDQSYLLSDTTYRWPSFTGFLVRLK